jgi:hypothetical protein
MLKLKVIGQEGERSVSLELNKTIKIGRSRSCDITLRNKEVSSKHCELTLFKDHILVRDLASTNGIYVNEEKVSSRKIFIHDTFRIANYTFAIDEFALSTEVFKRYTFADFGFDRFDHSIEGHYTVQKKLRQSAMNLSRKARYRPIQDTNDFGDSMAKDEKNSKIAMLIIFAQIVLLSLRDEKTFSTVDDQHFLYFGVFLFIQFFVIRFLLNKQDERNSC